MSLLFFFFFIDISPDFDNIIIRREKFYMNTIEENILILIFIIKII